ncbi:ImmA/IrrE family metallo-endopeptidase, partial [Listeria monocytogenes]|nr:ImmA/IrrE family metallo-endopeptidase [Listeria monocytogenes]
LLLSDIDIESFDTKKEICLYTGIPLELENFIIK